MSYKVLYKAKNTSTAAAAERHFDMTMTIFDLLQGDFPAEVPDTIRLLWISDKTYGRGYSHFMIRMRDDEKPPPPVEYFAAFMACSLRFESDAEYVFDEFKRRYADEEPLWVAAVETHLGSLRRRETPEADRLLGESDDPFFNALLKFKQAITMKKRRDDPALRDRDELITQPRLLLEQCLDVFRRRAAFYAGRACKEIWDDILRLDQQLPLIEEAAGHFKKSRMGHMIFRAREAKTQFNTRKKISLEETTLKNIKLGEAVTALRDCANVREFAAKAVDLFIDPDLFPCGRVRFLLERSDAGPETIAERRNPVSDTDEFFRIPIGFGYALEFDAFSNPPLIDLLLPSVKAGLSMIIDKSPQTPRTLPLTFGNAKFNDFGYASVVRLLRVAARSDIGHSVMMLGETGVGKEVCAKAIAEYGLTNGRFAIVECVKAKSWDAFIIDLCGTPPGSYTGQERGKIRKGLFESCEGGVIFLDEFGDLPAAAQSWLLTVMSTRSYAHWSGSGDEKGKRYPLNVKLICATNKPIGRWVDEQYEIRIQAAVDPETGENRIREDLFYRFHYSIEVPPLRNVPGQIAYLAVATAEKKGLSISPEAISLLQQYHFPGNIRQLVVFVEVACTTAQVDERTEITLADVRQVLSDNRVSISKSTDPPTSAAKGRPVPTVPRSEKPEKLVVFLEHLRDVLRNVPESRRQLFQRDDSVLSTLSFVMKNDREISPKLWDKIIEGLKSSILYRTEEWARKIDLLAETYREP